MVIDSHFFLNSPPPSSPHQKLSRFSSTRIRHSETVLSALTTQQLTIWISSRTPPSSSRFPPPSSRAPSSPPSLSSLRLRRWRRFLFVPFLQLPNRLPETLLLTRIGHRNTTKSRSNLFIKLELVLVGRVLELRVFAFGRTSFL